MHPVDTFMALMREARIQGAKRLTVGQMHRKLDAEGYWPARWPLAKKRAHIRWMMKKCTGQDGITFYLPTGPGDAKPNRSLLSPEAACAFLARIEDSHWQTLEEIRQKLLAAGYFPPSSEHVQTLALERLLGTEEHDPDPSLIDPDNVPLVACVWDDLDRPDPEPVYKVRTRWTEEDRQRILRHCHAIRAECEAAIRALESQ